MKWMTEEQVVEAFEESFKPFLLAQFGPDDEIALREAFNDYTDSLCKEGQISNKMYDTMDNPY